jgi:hypothetical protein
MDPTLLALLQQQQNPTPYNPNSGSVDSSAISNSAPLPSANTPSPSDVINQQWQQLYQPSNTAQTAYSSALGQMPQRSDFQPSKFQRIAAILAGMGTGRPAGVVGGQPIGFEGNPQAAYQTSSGILNAPYNQAMGDWQAKTKEMAIPAQMEQSQNLGQRQIAENILLREQYQRKQDEVERENLVKDKDAQQKIEISNNRAEAYIFSKNNPDWKAEEQKGGNLIFVNPKDPSQVYDTGYSSGMLTDRDKINLGISGRMQEIGAQGKNQMNVQGAIATRTGANIAARGKEARETKETPTAPKPGSITTTEVTPQTGGGIFGGPVVPAKKTVTTTPNVAPTKPKLAKPPSTDSAAAVRQRATDYLTTNKMPVTEANIQHLIDNVGKW